MYTNILREGNHQDGIRLFSVVPGKKLCNMKLEHEKFHLHKGKAHLLRA